jgi:polynucleotide 5'-hydroxyl-kinase GRC3/NOL9
MCAVKSLNIKILLARKSAQEERNIELFVLPKTWDQGASDLLDVCSRMDGGNPTILRPIVCHITGPRSSGKSTFAKMLSNRLVTRWVVSDVTMSSMLKYIPFSYAQVAVLDCDPGQSEFSLSGMVALTVISKPLFGT